jgi:hypothetical protein
MDVQSGERDENLLTRSPSELLKPFAHGRIGRWFFVAVLLHAVLIGGTSVGYILDRWVDPEGAAVRKAAAEAAGRAEAATNAPPAAAVPATNAAVAAAAPATAPSADTATDAELLRARGAAPVIQRITGRAATNEIPRQPDDLGISLEETNVR